MLVSNEYVNIKSVFKFIFTNSLNVFRLESIELINHRLLHNEKFTEDVVAYFKSLNHKISPKTGETCSILKNVINDEIACNFNWSGVNGKLALNNHILFSKIIYGLFSK